MRRGTPKEIKKEDFENTQGKRERVKVKRVRERERETRLQRERERRKRREEVVRKGRAGMESPHITTTKVMIGQLVDLVFYILVIWFT